jgi:L-fucono-1,5-lactonase
MRIDSHQHFWRYNPTQLPWITDAMDVLRRDYLPRDLMPLLRATGFDGTIAVQAQQVIDETEWLLRLADEQDFIRGVVGWVDLRSRQVDEQLKRFANHPKLVGVRHIVHDEPDDEFMLRPDFQRGIGKLQGFDLTYDLLLFPKHLPVAAKLVAQFSHQRFVLDHIAKPNIAEKQVLPWRDDLIRLARFPNVTCKLSGMVTEARWKQCRPEDFHPYLDAVVEAFGPDRLMIGSDWPVCTLSREYSPTMQIVMDYVQRLPPETRAGILGGNCARVYQLDGSPCE